MQSFFVYKNPALPSHPLSLYVCIYILLPSFNLGPFDVLIKYMWPHSGFSQAKTHPESLHTFLYRVIENRTHSLVQ